MNVSTFTIKKFIELSSELSRLALQLANKSDLDNKADIVLQAIKDYYPFDIMRKTRQPPYPEARFVACYIMQQYTELTQKEIASRLKLLDHTSVIHGSQRASELIEIGDEKICKEVYEIAEIVEGLLEKHHRDIQMNGASQGTMLRVMNDDNQKEEAA